MNRVRTRLEQYNAEIEKTSQYKQGLPGSALDIVNTLLTDMEEDEKENGWISVGKEPANMPEERNSMFAKFKGTNKWKEAMFEKISKDVLVTILYRNSLFVQQAHTVDGKWKNDLLTLGGTVIAWKPLPEPYREGIEHETD